MKHSGMSYGNSGFGDVACSGGVQKTCAMCAPGTGGGKKTSWTTRLIRNDFGIIAAKHEASGRSQLFMSMI
jgi:galactose-1-phosphate uridylyltransferase